MDLGENRVWGFGLNETGSKEGPGRALVKKISKSQDISRPGG
jgi:hypothetical protein